MKTRYSRIGFISSLAIHTAVFGGVLAFIHSQPTPPATEQISSISIEMMAALLEQEQVAVAPETVEEPKEEVEEPKPEPEPEPIPEPIPEPPKPKEKPKEKPKPEKKVEKKVEKKPIKALEKGPEPKQGIEAKAVAPQGAKDQIGTKDGSKAGNSAQSGSTSGGEVNAYKAELQRQLQRRANNSYPQREKMMRKTGVVTLKFSISASGQLVDVAVTNSSGNSRLDEAAVKAAERTQMSSAPPPGFPTSLTVPVRFSLE